MAAVHKCDDALIATKKSGADKLNHDSITNNVAEEEHEFYAVKAIDTVVIEETLYKEKQIGIDAASTSGNVKSFLFEIYGINCSDISLKSQLKAELSTSFEICEVAISDQYKICGIIADYVGEYSSISSSVSIADIEHPRLYATDSPTFDEDNVTAIGTPRKIAHRPIIHPSSLKRSRPATQFFLRETKRRRLQF